MKKQEAKIQRFLNRRKRMVNIVFFTWDGKHRLDFHHSTDLVTPKSEYPHHMHVGCELYLFVRGPKTEYVVEDSCFQLHSGDIILTKPEEMHHPNFIGEGEYECFYLKIPVDCFEGLSNRMQSPLHCFLDRDFGTKNLLRMKADEQRECIRLCYKILQERDFPNDNSRLLCFSYVLQILAIVNHAFDGACSQPSDTILSPMMREILNYVNTNVSTIQSTEEVAKQFFITPSYFSRLFRNSMGITFVKYLRAKKISLAKNSLIRGANVTDACYDSGFSDYSYFISTFHKETGMTPLQYQKKVRKGQSE